MKIKFSKSEIDNKDIKKVSEVLKSGWLTHGKYSKTFEEQIKKFTGSKYCTLVSNCTAGLHISCIAANFKKGDEILVPSVTHTATAHAVELTGAKAVICDVNNKNGNLDIENIKKKVTTKTKGVILVHMSGISCNLKPIISFCKKKKIIILEDCAHGMGTYYNQKHVGNFGLTGSFSFYPTKQITTGEGGAVITNSKKIYNKIKSLKAFGIDKEINDRKKQGHYDVKFLGLNYRMTDFQACLGYRQLKRYKNNLQRRKLIAKRYINNLKNIKNLKITPYDKNYSYFVYQIFCKSRDKVLKKFKKQNIGVSVHYARPLHRTSFYKKKYILDPNNYPNSDKYSSQNISLPVYPKLKFSEIDYLCKKLKEIISYEK